MTRRFTTCYLAPRVCIRATDGLGECAWGHVAVNPPSASRLGRSVLDKIVTGIALKAGAAEEMKNGSAETVAAAGYQTTTTRSLRGVTRSTHNVHSLAQPLREERALLDVRACRPHREVTSKTGSVVRGLEQLWVGHGNQQQFSVLEHSGRSGGQGGGQGGGRPPANRTSVFLVSARQHRIVRCVFSTESISTPPVPARSFFGSFTPWEGRNYSSPVLCCKV